MAAASLIPTVLDAVVAGLRAYSTGDVTFRSPVSSASGVTVYDGPEWRLPATDPDGFLVIGYGGEDLDDRADDGEQGADVVTGDQQVRAIATSSPKQQADDQIECVAFWRSGSVDTSQARAQAWAIVDAVDTFLRADPKVGVTASAAGQVMWVQLTSRSMSQWLNSGSRCAVRFTLTAHTRT